MRNILLTIAYDGTNFSGWQRQPNRRTVQGELEKALSAVCGKPITVNGTSRTDAGVHAYGQCASFCGEFGIPTDRLMVAVNHLLAGGQHVIGAAADVRITSVAEKPPEFHARFSAQGKTYFYRIRNAAEQDVFMRNYTYQTDKPLAVKAMKDGAAHMIGTHDFKCFQAAGSKELPSTVRTIADITIAEEIPMVSRWQKCTGSTAGEMSAKETSAACNFSEEKYITIAVTGDGFLYHMIRNITGTLVEIGQGKRKPSEVPEIIASRNRQRAGHTAPPQGLYLARVYYGKEE